MYRILIRSGVFILILALLFFAGWALNQFGVVDIKTTFLQTVSFIPGLNDLADNYELGNKRNQILQQRENDIKKREALLANAQKKLAQDRDSFTNEQNQWLNDHPVTKKPTTTTTGNNNGPSYINQPLTSDAKIKDYLSMLGKMKPRQAASVIQKLPEETVFTIFDQLNHFQVIKIMENLPEDYLAKLTQDRLNKYRNL